MSLKKINLESLDNIPSIANLIQKSKALATLDAILMPDWNYRYYSFDSNWDIGEMMASMRTGSGDHYFILFENDSAIIKEFNQDATLIDKFDNQTIINELSHELPKKFENFLKEPAFKIDELTFLSWCQISGKEWKTGRLSQFSKNDLTTSAERITAVTGDYSDYINWAEEYYEVKVDKIFAESVFDGVPLTNEMVITLNPELTLDDIREDLDEIGYPTA
ncbi:hypothetical protein [uncultured Zobellia sp.]|uniref:hypothetical protein n=1 Tax=uncultured Zobellia sp. TaxID=255433 RepID=UPI002597D7E3|nr:hypothetical protein [uncultured Zobellia sp.]